MFFYWLINISNWIYWNDYYFYMLNYLFLVSNWNLIYKFNDLSYNIIVHYSIIQIIQYKQVNF